MLPPLFTYTVLFVYGLLIGSFLNVCIWRIPRGERLGSLPSHCTSCGARIGWYDLLPVVSYLTLRGRCRRCKAPISVRYPLIELLNGTLYLLIILADERVKTGGLPTIGSLMLCLLTSVLIVISGIDFETYEIPPRLNAIVLLLGVIATLMDTGKLIEHLLGFICISGFLYLLYLLSKGRAIGGGDVKLMAAAGLYLGWKYITLAFFIGCILGSILHLLRMKIAKAEHMLAMGPYLSMGIYISALYGRELIDWYLKLAGL
jgi:leader peptidase (prepilin peptidase)/N-methyltransferase